MAEARKGRLKIFMGYAAGVGKTYKMLEEAQKLCAEGVDVAIGYFEPHGRAETIAKTGGLELIPRRVVDYRGARFEEMDADAILARKPAVCVVDEFPHTNIPGAERAKRWEDVQALLDAGIDVLTTMNIQHLESLNDQVWQVSGIRVRETIPDWVVQGADEVVMIDLTPRALVHRLQRGVVYSKDKAEKALNNFFRESTLVALRELAMRQTAHEVESRHAWDLVAHDETGHHAENGAARRILVLVEESPKTALLIRRARRISDFTQAECFAVAVVPGGGLASLAPKRREAIEELLAFARNLRIESRVLEGEDTAEAVIEFARRNQISQIFVTRPMDGALKGLVQPSAVQRIIATATDIQIVIVSDREKFESA